jgi:hypothetical protein
MTQAAAAAAAAVHVFLHYCRAPFLPPRYLEMPQVGTTFIARSKEKHQCGGFYSFPMSHVYAIPLSVGLGSCSEKSVVCIYVFPGARSVFSLLLIIARCFYFFSSSLLFSALLHPPPFAPSLRPLCVTTLVAYALRIPDNIKKIIIMEDW